MNVFTTFLLATLAALVAVDTQLTTSFSPSQTDDCVGQETLALLHQLRQDINNGVRCLGAPPSTRQDRGCICNYGTTELSTNRALRKPSYQSSSRIPYTANNSNDGSRGWRASDFHIPCSLTHHEANPWWAVDLGLETCVVSVIFVNRGDDRGGARRSDDFIIGLTNDSPLISPPTLWNYTVCGQWRGKVGQGATVQLQCEKGTHGRYVIVQLPRTEVLNFCELEVYGCGL